MGSLRKVMWALLVMIPFVPFIWVVLGNDFL
jgi:hypothetical protein